LGKEFSMRTRERGIGNLAFIAVLVLLVIAIAMFFVKQSDADNWQALHKEQKAIADKSLETIQSAGKAYDKWVELAGLDIPELSRGQDTYSDPVVIADKVTGWMMTQAGEIATKSQAKIKRGQWQVDTANNVVRVTETGDQTTIQLFNSGYVKETVTFAGFVAPLGEQYRWAAQAIEANNTKYEEESKGFQTRLAALQQQLTEAGTRFQADIASKAQLYDTEKSRASQFSDTVQADTQKIDNLNSQISTLKTEFEKATKSLTRENSALQNRIIAEKKAMEIAEKEDPADGEVLVADARQGLVFLNRGRNFRVAPDMKFRVWRLGKGSVREHVAEVEVIESSDTKSTARVIKLYNPRIPVSEGMNFSSPFYDPHKKLRIYIAGALRYYPSDLAKRRLAESGCSVSERLDDTVNVVVLGEPAVDLGEEATSPEEAAANEEKAKAMREARIREIRETARTLGAVVVTEDVLRTFIEY
jgi:hypothetical protein